MNKSPHKNPSQDAHTFTQQPSTATPTPVIQLQNTTDMTDNDQSQLNQISAGCSNYSLQPFRVQASSSHHFAPMHDLQQVGTVLMRDPAHHLSDPGLSNQFLYGASHFQLQQQHFSSTSTTLQHPAVATPSPKSVINLFHIDNQQEPIHIMDSVPRMCLGKQPRKVGILAILLIGTN